MSPGDQKICSFPCGLDFAKALQLTPPQLIFRCRETRQAQRKSVKRQPVVPCRFEGKLQWQSILSVSCPSFLRRKWSAALARALGVNEAVAQKVVAAAVPAILASLGTAAAAPGGAQKVSDAISNSDPDILTKVSQAASGGNARFLNDGANLLSGLLGGGGLSSLVGALSQFSGAPHPATQTLLGAVDASGGRHDRPAGPLELVGPVGDSFAAQQSEGRDLRRASA